MNLYVSSVLISYCSFFVSIKLWLVAILVVLRYDYAGEDWKVEWEKQVVPRSGDDLSIVRAGEEFAFGELSLVFGDF